MFNKLTLDDVTLTGETALVRVDFNVPLDEHGRVREFTRIKASLPTIHNILDYDAAAVLMSHFGRPKGERIEKYSLKPVAQELQRLLQRDVQFAPDCIGPEVEAMVKNLQPSEVLLLENVRFHPGETENSVEFARELAKMGTIYVNDAFGAAHRKQASIDAITQFFPGKAVAGRLMMREMKFLSRALQNPVQPFIGIVGGSKISSKIKTIQRLLPRVDKLLIGGGMTYTLVKAQGGKIGSSLYEEDQLALAREIIEGADADKLILPIDSIVARDLEYGSERKTYPSNEIPDGWRGLDLGRESRDAYVTILKTAKTVFWNGPMGFFEREPFATGTRIIARALVDLAANGGIAVVGGGDTMAALNRFNLTGPMTHISTGGGSLLEFMEGKPLPGYEALSDNESEI